ncbi:hypothetical protein PQ478_08450 [Alkalihalophilus pseudofirmus]|uniref:hypothetical protein n=1 Tax=Alkalihalophilus pseudofirmus TaxID=79885 RepID=UPI00259BB62B|nr:hypothetical protein [Alkalihalophilus pseudofirmus]WEG18498.1 hypothetical protein PQ478_08450 [Alkalihalophilus pseudofirmus]
MVRSKNFTDLGSLFAGIEAAVNSTLRDKQGSVARHAVETAKRHVEVEVYQSYNPQFYTRTGQLKESWEVQLTIDGLMIVNTRNEDGKDIAYIVHEADGYTMSFPFENVPRRFRDTAVEELKNDAGLRAAFLSDLRKRGFNVM